MKTITIRPHILAALENICRRDHGRPYSPTHYSKGDNTAVNWGPHAPEIQHAAMKLLESPITYQQARRTLENMVADGTVLRASPHSRIVRYWPVGRWEKLQAERGGA